MAVLRVGASALSTKLAQWLAAASSAMVRSRSVSMCVDAGPRPSRSLVSAAGS